MKKILLAGILLSSTVSFGQVLSEDFESVSAPALPAGWASTSTGDNFITGTSVNANAGGYWPVPASGTFAMANDDVCNCDMSAVYLTTPSMNFTGMSGLAVTYDVVDDGNYGGNPHEVEVSINGGSTWTNVYTHTFNPAVVWETAMVTLGAATDNQANVMVRFKYDDGGSWASGVAIDNVVVDALPPVEAELSSITLARYAASATNSTLTMNVTNLGANTITSIVADWNDGTSHSSTIATNIASGQTVAVVHPTAVNYAVATEANITVTITSVNGGADANAANNGGAALHNTVSQIVPKNVVFEEGTGTWCGWCPRGAVAMEYMATTYPDQFIGIAVHNGDPMTVAAYDAAADFSGFPGSNIDRVLLDQSVSQAGWVATFNARKNMIVPAAITVTPSGTGANVVMDVDATFYTPFAAANYRLAVIMVENDVTGTGASYNQANYYSGGGSGAMGGYEALPDPVPAAQMVYDHVGRALLGGYTGQAGSVPAVIADGGVASYTFNYTVPGTSDRNQMHAVAVLIDQTNGEIVTGVEVSVAEAGISEMEAMLLSVYPNPANDVMNIAFEANQNDYTVELIDLQGRVVKSGTYNNLSGAQLISFSVTDLNKGSYMVKISTNEGSKTKAVIIQ